MANPTSVTCSQTALGRGRTNVYNLQLTASQGLMGQVFPVPKALTSYDAGTETVTVPIPTQMFDQDFNDTTGTVVVQPLGDTPPAPYSPAGNAVSMHFGPAQLGPATNA